MKNNESEKDFFDDDFEVIYEYLDDYNPIAEEKPSRKPTANGVSKKPGTRNQSQPKQQKKSETARKPIPDTSVSPSRKSTSEKSMTPSGKAAPGKSVTPSRKTTPGKSVTPIDNRRQKYRKKRRKAPNLLSPAASTAKTGGKAISKIARFLLRYGSIVIIGYIIFLTAYRLWNGRTAYGDIYLLFKQENYILGTYTGTACILLLYELISLFWAFSGPKIIEGRRIQKIDTGRGFLFFILILAGSFLSATFVSFIPQSPSPLQGLSGALKIYGGLHSVLLPVCGIGAILCIVRKFVTK